MVDFFPIWMYNYGWDFVVGQTIVREKARIMSEGKTLRRKEIDMMKGIAIAAVVLYHMGLLESGYLGVDVFFVIAGFLTVPGILSAMEEERFSYFGFIWKRIIRLLPAILIASAVCLMIGFFFWLPDDYENLAESIIASVAFSNNILAGITTKDYWNTVNDYKPLMHFWYLGILMEFYLTIPILTYFLKKLSRLFRKNGQKIIVGGYMIITLISLILFLSPAFPASDQFYFLPFRYYELMMGGLIGVAKTEMKKEKEPFCRWLFGLFFGLLILLLCNGAFTFDISKMGLETNVIGGVSGEGWNDLLLPNDILVLLTVIVSAILLLLGKTAAIRDFCHLSAVGKRSYGIFVWHQVMLAVYRYSISNRITLMFVIAFFLILCLISELHYRFVEKIQVNKRNSICVVLVSILLCGISGVLYLRAGVVRDVPELGITVDHVHRNMHAEYCDRIYDYDVDFSSTDQLKVLIIGNSFARDFGNILLESEYADEIELSYSFSYENSLTDRIQQADRIFVFGYKSAVPAYVWENVSNENRIYGIGTKTFGTLNGEIYFHRYRKDYYSMTVSLDPGYALANQALRQEWGNHYIDMLEPVSSGEKVRVFTDTNMFISQDTKHLTQAGAQYYARILNLADLLFGNGS